MLKLWRDHCLLLKIVGKVSWSTTPSIYVSTLGLLTHFLAHKDRKSTQVRRNIYCKWQSYIHMMMIISNGLYRNHRYFPFTTPSKEKTLSSPSFPSLDWLFVFSNMWQQILCVLSPFTRMTFTRQNVHSDRYLLGLACSVLGVTEESFNNLRQRKQTGWLTNCDELPLLGYLMVVPAKSNSVLVSFALDTQETLSIRTGFSF